MTSPAQIQAWRSHANVLLAIFLDAWERADDAALREVPYRVVYDIRLEPMQIRDKHDGQVVAVIRLAKPDATHRVPILVWIRSCPDLASLAQWGQQLSMKGIPDGTQPDALQRRPPAQRPRPVRSRDHRPRHE